MSMSLVGVVIMILTLTLSIMIWLLHSPPHDLEHVGNSNVVVVGLSLAQLGDVVDLGLCVFTKIHQLLSNLASH